MLSDFGKFLFELNNEPIKIINKLIDFVDYTPLDLSVSNTNLNKELVSNSNHFQEYINTYMAIRKAKVAYGGYNEQRGIYKRSTHFNNTNTEERDIHLGIDLWVNANSKVYTPLDGDVFGFSNNAGFGNYGPTIILKHNIKNTVFYTLYGHLSLESLSGLTNGKSFIKGDKIASLGTAEVNGDYPPHLHFQIIKDIGNWKNDYPGVCSQSEREIYLSNCPNPNLLLKIDA